MRAVVLPVVGCGVGCTSLNRYSAHPVPPPAEFVASGAPVTIRDGRPKWEKESFRNAISLLAFQDVTPAPWDGLREQVEQAVAAAEGKPVRVEVVAASYRVVVKDPELVKREEAERERSRQDAAMQYKGTFLGSLVDAFVSGLLEPPGYPREVLAEPDGVTCTLEVDVRLTWPDGRVTAGRVSALQTAADKDPRRGWRAGIEQTVRAAAAEFGTGFRLLNRT